MVILILFVYVLIFYVMKYAHMQDSLLQTLNYRSKTFFDKQKYYYVYCFKMSHKSQEHLFVVFYFISEF